jgi:hypothetical protein
MKSFIAVIALLIHFNSIEATAQSVNENFPIIRIIDSSEFRSKFALQSISEPSLDSVLAAISDSVGFVYIFRNSELNGNLIVSLSINHNRVMNINSQLFKSGASATIPRKITLTGSLKRKLNKVDFLKYEKGLFTAWFTGSTCILLEQIFIVKKGNLESGIFVLDACGSENRNRGQMQESLWNVRKIIREELPKIEKQLKRYD